MPLLPTLLFCLVQAPAPLPDLGALARINALEKARDWAGLADFCETLPAPQRQAYLFSWLQGLERSARWTRLLQVCEDPALVPRIPWHFKGRALVELGRPADALAWLLPIGRKGDAVADLEAWNAGAAVADLPAMLECSERLVARYPGHGVYLGMKGEVLARLARYPEAEPLLAQATTLAPTRAMSWADLACCMNERAAYSDALEAADRALALDARLIEGRCNHGRALVGLKRYPEARADFAAALALKPKDAALAANLKVLLAQTDAYLAGRAQAAKAKRAAGKGRP